MYEKRPGDLRIAHVLGQHPLRVTKGLARARGRILTEGAPGSNDVIGASHWSFTFCVSHFVFHFCFIFVFHTNFDSASTVFSNLIGGGGSNKQDAP